MFFQAGAIIILLLILRMLFWKNVPAEEKRNPD